MEDLVWGINKHVGAFRVNKEEDPTHLLHRGVHSPHEGCIPPHGGVGWRGGGFQSKWDTSREVETSPPMNTNLFPPFSQPLKPPPLLGIVPL